MKNSSAPNIRRRDLTQKRISRQFSKTHVWMQFGRTGAGPQTKSASQIFRKQIAAPSTKNHQAYPLIWKRITIYCRCGSFVTLPRLKDPVTGPQPFLPVRLGLLPLSPPCDARSPRKYFIRATPLSLSPAPLCRVGAGVLPRPDPMNPRSLTTWIGAPPSCSSPIAYSPLHIL